MWWHILSFYTMLQVMTLAFSPICILCNINWMQTDYLLYFLHDNFNVIWVLYALYLCFTVESSIWVVHLSVNNSITLEASLQSSFKWLFIHQAWTISSAEGYLRLADFLSTQNQLQFELDGHWLFIYLMLIEFTWEMNNANLIHIQSTSCSYDRI